MTNKQIINLLLGCPPLVLMQQGGSAETTPTIDAIAGFAVTDPTHWIHRAVNYGLIYAKKYRQSHLVRLFDLEECLKEN